MVFPNDSTSRYVTFSTASAPRGFLSERPRQRLHRRSSECVVNPERYIIHVLSRRRLPQKRSREEVDVARQYCDVPRRVPGQRDRGRAADERIPAQLPGPNWRTDERPVDPVFYALPPDKRPVGQQRQLVAQPDVRVRMQLNKVRRTDRVSEVEVGPRGEHGIKGLKVRRARIAVA